MQMNKTDLIKMVAEKANKPTKEVAEIIDSFFKELSQNLREKDVSITLIPQHYYKYNFLST